MSTYSWVIHLVILIWLLFSFYIFRCCSSRPHLCFFCDCSKKWKCIACWVGWLATYVAILILLRVFDQQQEPQEIAPRAAPSNKTLIPFGWTENEAIKYFARYVTEKLDFEQGQLIIKHDGLAVFSLVLNKNGIIHDSNKWEYLQFMCASANNEIHLVTWGGYSSSGDKIPNLSAFNSFDSQYRSELESFSKELLDNAFSNPRKPRRDYSWSEILPAVKDSSKSEPLHIWILDKYMDEKVVLNKIASEIQSRSKKFEEHNLGSGAMYSSKEVITKAWLNQGWMRTWFFILRLNSGEVRLVSEGGFAATGDVIPDIESFYPFWKSENFRNDFHNEMEKILEIISRNSPKMIRTTKYDTSETKK